MPYSIAYFNERVAAEIERWPVGLLADYVRLVELLVEFGPDLRMPRSRALGGGLFELRARGREGIGRALYCFLDEERVVVLHAFVKKTRTTPAHELKIAPAHDGGARWLTASFARWPTITTSSSRER
jgi:phage-related protein